MIIKNISGRSRRRRIANRPANRRLQLESLEDRRPLAVFSPIPSVDDGTPDSLRSAIVASQSNQEDDTIQLGEGIYTLRLGDLLIDEPNTNLRIEGVGVEQTVIVIEGDARAFDVDFDGRLEMSGVAILAGNADEGGQIRSAGTVVLSDVILQNGTAIQGGAIFNGGDLTLTDVDLVGNEAGVGGAIWNHAGATLTANDTRWLSNVTSEHLGALILSPAQVGIVMPDSDNHTSVYSTPPRGATALFNAGTAHLQSVEIAGNVSETGAAIHNVGDAAELRIEDSLIYENQSAPREGLAPSVLLGMRGNVDILQTAIFNNSSRFEGGGTISLLSGAIDLNHVSIFNNPSPSHGIMLKGSSVRMEHVTYVRSGPRGMEIKGAAHTVIDITASAMDIVGVETGSGQFRSGGGNWTGLAGGDDFDNPTDHRLSSEKQQEIFWHGNSFDFLPPGIYQGRVGIPPTATSELIDALPNGEDSGAFEFVAGMELEAPLPSISTGDLTVQEDGEPLLIDSLVSGAVKAVAAHGVVSTNDQGQLVYQTETNYHGRDRLVVQGSDGHLQSWEVVVAPQADPPTIEDYSVTVLGRSEVLGRERLSTEVTDMNAVSASFDRDSFFPPDGNPSSGPDVGSELTKLGLVIDGELVQSGPQWGDRGEIPYYLSGDVARPWLKIDYLPEPGFSGPDPYTVRVVNSSGLSAEATVTYDVLDPATHPKIGRLSAVILDANFQPVDTVRVGDLFYVEYRIEDIRDDNHPLSSSQRDFSRLKAIFNIGGAQLRVARVCRSDCENPMFGGDGKMNVSPEILGGFLGTKHPPTQLDASNLRVDADVMAIDNRSGPFYRVAFNGLAAGTITADTPFVIGHGAGILGEIPYDWFEIVTDSVEVISANTNTNLPEDVNEDGIVAPGDALIVINALNDLSAESERAGQSAITSGQYKVDVNGDGQLAPGDALIVVNYLNRNNSIATGEGEASSTVPQPLSYPLQDTALSLSENQARAELIDEVMANADNDLYGDDIAVPYPTASAASNETRERILRILGESDDEEDEVNRLDTSLEEAIKL